MRKYKYIIFLLILSVFMANASAQENNTSSDNSKNQPTAVFLDTKNKTGHLVYKEEYYIQDGSGVKLDKSIKHFDGDINSSRIKLTFNRPLDKSGMPYNGSMIKAIAILNNETILNGWYKDRPKNSTGNAAASKKTPGFEALMAITAVLLLVSARRIR